MGKPDDPWAECKWDSSLVGLLVAGLVKSLIQARWKGDSGFLPDADLTPWFRADLAELRDDTGPPVHTCSWRCGTSTDCKS